jgi:signal transduction histidine kinase
MSRPQPATASTSLTARARWRGWIAYALAWTTLALVWALTAKTSSKLPLAYVVRVGVTTMATAALLGIAVWRLTGRLTWNLRSPAFYAVHAVGALLYGLSFTLASLVLEIPSGAFGRSFAMSWSSGVFGWNVLMGSWLYVIVAGLAYGIRAQQKLDQQAKAEAEARMLADRAQLAALRARLNPHFLFNALHTVSSLVATDPAAADDAIERLGNLLRYALDESTDEIPLEREWAFTRDYLSFERLRLGDRLRVREALDAEARAADVPLLVLQPLVENAVRHAVAVSPGGGTIQISARVEHGTLRLSVEDDGPGGDRPGIENSRGLGLRALKRRLDVRYGGQARVDIRTAPGAGFAVTVVLPAEHSIAAGAA